MMNNDSYNISISFKTNLAQLKMMEKARSTHFMSRSELIRSGIILMMTPHAHHLYMAGIDKLNTKDYESSKCVGMNTNTKDMSCNQSVIATMVF